MLLFYCYAECRFTKCRGTSGTAPVYLPYLNQVQLLKSYQYTPIKLDNFFTVAEQASLLLVNTSS